MLPAYGVYAVRVTREGAGAGKSGFRGVANIGMRPTVDGSALRIEAHLFDFDQDLYGERLRIDLVARLRGERKFEGLEELRAQIANDAESARKSLSKDG